MIDAKPVQLYGVHVQVWQPILLGSDTESLQIVIIIRVYDSDVNKDFSHKAKAKDLGHKAKAKDSGHKAEAKAKDLKNGP